MTFLSWAFDSCLGTMVGTHVHDFLDMFNQLVYHVYPAGGFKPTDKY